MARLTLPTLIVMPLLGPLCWVGSAQAALISNLPTPDAELAPFSASAPVLLAYSVSIRQQPLSDAMGAIRTHVPTPADAAPVTPAAPVSNEPVPDTAAPRSPVVGHDVWRTPVAPVEAAVPEVAPSAAVSVDAKPGRAKVTRQRAVRQQAKRQRVVRKSRRAPVEAAVSAPAVPVVATPVDAVVVPPINEVATVAVVQPVTAPVSVAATPLPGFWSRYWTALAAPYREAAAAREARAAAVVEPVSVETDHAAEAAALTAVGETPLPSIPAEPVAEPVQVALIPDVAASVTSEAPSTAPAVVDPDPAIVEPTVPASQPAESVATMVTFHAVATEPKAEPVLDVTEAGAPVPVPALVPEAAPAPALAVAPVPDVVPVAAATPIAESVMIAMPPVAPPPMLPPVMVVAEQSVTAPAIPAVVMPAPKLPQWRLEGGKPIDAQLQAWAEASGWKLDWRLDKTWLPPADVFYEGSFDSVIEKIITGLHAEGESVRLTLWSGNRYAEVVHADVK